MTRQTRRDYERFAAHLENAKDEARRADRDGFPHHARTQRLRARFCLAAMREARISGS